jgi:predicted enzyme related to lactoylglutathione lyase
MKAIVHFEIQASDIDRAIKFYSEVFEWKIERYGEMEYWGIYTGRGTGSDGGQVGINGGLLPRKGGEPVDGAAVNAFVCTIEVDDIDAMIKKVKTAGGKIVVDKADIAGMMWQAFCKDSDGNIFGLMQSVQPGK